MAKAKPAAAPAVPAAAKKKLKAAEKVAVKAQQKKVVGSRRMSKRCCRSRPFALPATLTSLCTLPCAEGAAVLLWQAKKPVVVEESDEESEEDAPVNGAAAPATPAKVGGPLLLPPAPSTSACMCRVMAGSINWKLHRATLPLSTAWCLWQLGVPCSHGMSVLL